MRTRMTAGLNGIATRGEITKIDQNSEIPNRNLGVPVVHDDICTWDHPSAASALSHSLEASCLWTVRSYCRPG